MTIAAAYRRAKCARNQDEVRYLRALTDHLWQDPYRRAVTLIEWHAAQRSPWCKVRVPFACDDEMEAFYEWVLAVATFHGYERRPGGPSGNAFDLIFFELTGVHGPDVGVLAPNPPKVFNSD